MSSPPQSASPAMPRSLEESVEGPQQVQLSSPTSALKAVAEATISNSRPRSQSDGFDDPFLSKKLENQTASASTLDDLNDQLTKARQALEGGSCRVTCKHTLADLRTLLPQRKPPRSSLAPAPLFLSPRSHNWPSVAVLLRLDRGPLASHHWATLVVFQRVASQRLHSPAPPLNLPPLNSASVPRRATIASYPFRLSLRSAAEPATITPLALSRPNGSSAGTVLALLRAEGVAQAAACSTAVAPIIALHSLIGKSQGRLLALVHTRKK